MDASSLIFLVIIALWAVYLVPSWIRQRRRMGSARVSDRDSAAMRVVVRGSSAGNPAATAESDISSRSMMTNRVERQAVSSASPASSLPGNRSRGVEEAVRDAGSGVSRASRAVRRRRLAVLSVVALAVIGWLCTALGVLSWVVAAAPSTALVAMLAGLAASAAVRRRSAPAATKHVAASTVVEPTVVEPTVVESTVVESTVVDPAVVQPMVVRPVGVEEPAAAGSAGTGHLPAQRPQAKTSSARRPDESTWVPTAVPLPTYLLKPKAPSQPAPRPWLDADEDVDDLAELDVRPLRGVSRAVNQ